MRTLITIIFLFLWQSEVWATNIYLSSDGDDLNNGTSAALAIKTIARLNTLWIQVSPGDTVFLRCGDIFTGTIKPTVSGTDASPIVITSYGIGNQPIICGSVPVTNFTTYSGNVYMANLAGVSVHNIESVYMGSTLINPSRFPNSGYIYTTADADSVTLLASALSQPDGYFVGSNVTHRSRNWVYERRLVTSSEFGKINIDTANDFSYQTEIGRGLFFTNALKFIDSPDEWYYNQSTTTLYVWLNDTLNPNLLNVRVPIREYNYGLLIDGRSHFKVENIAFTNGSMGGVRAQNATNIFLSGIKIYKTSGIGIFMNNVTKPKIVNCQISDMVNTGIQLSGCKNYKVTHNKISRCGLNNYYINGYSRWGITSNSGYGGLIAFNFIDTVGSSGILLVDSFSVVEKNFINNSCASITDNGAIYLVAAGKSKQNTPIHADTIRYNFICNTKGDTSGTTHRSTLVQGIDISDYSGHCYVAYNTVYDNAQDGIKVFGGFNNTVTHNLCFNNNETQFAMGTSLSLFKVTDVANNLIVNNQFISANEDQLPFMLYADSTFYDFGVYDSNFYFNPYGHVSLSLKYESGSTTFFRMPFLSRWKTLQTNNNQHSMEGKPTFFHFKITDTISPNLITNGSFDGNVLGWTSSSPTLSHIASGGINGGTLTVGSPTSGNITTRSNTFVINDSGVYFIRFYVKASGPGKIRLSLNKENTATLYSKYKYVEINSDTKLIEALIVAKSNASDAQLVLRTQDEDTKIQYYIDDVCIYKVKATEIERQTQIELLTNPSDTVKLISSDGKLYANIYGDSLCNTLTLNPYSSMVVLTLDYNADSIYAASSTGLTTIIKPQCFYQHFNNYNKRLISINNNNQNLGNTFIKTYIDTGSVVNYLGNYFIKRHYKIEADCTFNNMVNIRLYFTKAEFQSLKNASPIINNVSDLTILHYSGLNADSVLNNNLAGTENIIFGNLITVNEYADGYYIEFSVESFSEFWIGDKQPISLSLTQLKLHLTSDLQCKSLYWDVNGYWPEGSYFVISRLYSEHEKQKINSFPYSTLNYNDCLQTKKTYGYQIEMFDKNNNFIASDVVRANKKEGIAKPLNIYPNPASRVITIKNYEGETVNILSVTGKVTTHVVDNNGEIQLDNLIEGFYILQTFDNQIEYFLKTK